jgi:hypothetical protein
MDSIVHLASGYGEAAAAAPRPGHPAEVAGIRDLDKTHEFFELIVPCRKDA